MHCVKQKDGSFFVRPKQYKSQKGDPIGTECPLDVRLSIAFAMQERILVLDALRDSRKKLLDTLLIASAATADPNIDTLVRSEIQFLQNEITRKEKVLSSLKATQQTAHVKHKIQSVEQELRDSNNNLKSLYTTLSAQKRDAPLYERVAKCTELEANLSTLQKEYAALLQANKELESKREHTVTINQSEYDNLLSMLDVASKDIKSLQTSGVPTDYQSLAISAVAKLNEQEKRMLQLYIDKQNLEQRLAASQFEAQEAINQAAVSEDQLSRLRNEIQSTLQELTQYKHLLSISTRKQVELQEQLQQQVQTNMKNKNRLKLYKNALYGLVNQHNSMIDKEKEHRAQLRSSFNELFKQTTMIKKQQFIAEQIVQNVMRLLQDQQQLQKFTGCISSGEVFEQCLYQSIPVDKFADEYAQSKHEQDMQELALLTERLPSESDLTYDLHEWPLDIDILPSMYVAPSMRLAPLSALPLAGQINPQALRDQSSFDVATELQEEIEEDIEEEKE